jgi:hypothetical protein
MLARSSGSIGTLLVASTAVLSLLLARTLAAECTIHPDGSSTCAEPLECGIYMAPSTLGEETNMGIYTGQALKANDIVNFPEIAIPLLFREWGEHKAGYEGTYCSLL